MLGATSLVGSEFVASSRLGLSAAGRADPRAVGLRVERFDRLDLSDPAEVERHVRSAPEPVVVNFAARTDVDAVERERSESTTPSGPAWAVNALAPEAVARGARKAGKFFVQLSTDFVFDGTRGPYGEDAPRSPLSTRMSWYGWTKSEGERRASGAGADLAVVRISYPYRAAFAPKLDFARWMLARHRDGTLPPLYANQQISPTWVPDVTGAVETLVLRRAPGVFHVASPELTTPWEFGLELLAHARGSAVEVERGTLVEPVPGSGVAPRPIRGGLAPGRAQRLGVRLTPWRLGIRELLSAQGRGR